MLSPGNGKESRQQLPLALSTEIPGANDTVSHKANVNSTREPLDCGPSRVDLGLSRRFPTLSVF